MQTDLPVRIAYLILACDWPNHVGRLVEQLDDGNAKFFIHVDRKSDIEPFRSAVHSQRVVFLDERLAINWGGWRMVQATLNGLGVELILFDERELADTVLKPHTATSR